MRSHPSRLTTGALFVEVLFALLAYPGAMACTRPHGVTGNRDAGGANAAWCATSAPDPEVSKREMASALLKGSSIYVHLDPRRNEVLVPKEYRDKYQLILQIGYALPLPIPDLELSEEGFSATLSFHHEPSFCRVPWSAVYAMVNEEGKGGAWYTSVPQELRCKE
jgi:hypothetical protein